MIRALGLLLLFAVGLAAAALWSGQMHHLRRALPDQLPGWSVTIADDAGLRAGQAEWPAAGNRPAIKLAWIVKAPGAEGLLWDLRATGQGIDIQSELLLPYWPVKAIIRNGSGGVDLEQWPAQSADLALKGLINVQEMDLRLGDLFGTPTPHGTLTGAARTIAVNGADLGTGPLTAQLDEAGDWQAKLVLAGGISDAEATLSGTLSAILAQLDLFVADASALPESAARALTSLGQSDGAGLRLSLPVPLK